MTTATSIEPGIYTMDRAAYDKIGAVNASLLLAGPTMAHRKAYADGFHPTSDAQAFGIANHMFLLEPERFATHYVVKPKIKCDASTEAYKAYLAEVGGDESRLLWPEEVRTFEAMREALHKSARRRALAVAPGRYEVVIVWRDGPTGLLCKGMLDKLIEKIDTVVDLKRAIAADDFSFAKAAVTHGYEQRAAFYMDGLLTLTKRAHDYVFLAQEPKPPYASAMYRMEHGDETYRVGRWKYRQTLAGWAQCLRSGVYPDYGNDVQPLILPKWAIPQNMMEDDDDRIGNNETRSETDSTNNGRIIPTDRPREPVSVGEHLPHGGDAAEGL